MDLATQKSAYRKDDRTRSELQAHRRDDAGNAAVFDPEVGDFGLERLGFGGGSRGLGHMGLTR